MRILLVSSVALLGAVGCSTADNPNSPLAGPTLPPGLAHQAGSREVVLLNEDGERVICRTEPMIGSRIGNRVCHTEAEWERIEEEREHLDSSGVAGRPASPF